MGEAKRRRERAEAGLPSSVQARCVIPSCRSHRIHRHDVDTDLAKMIAKAWGNRAVCPIDQCEKCGTIWEPWPDDFTDPIYRDHVARPPCDNCAYSAGGSGEAGMGDEVPNLIELARAAAKFKLGRDDMMLHPGRFCCHKGIPIRLARQAANGSIEFDFKAADIDPMYQPCTGYLRVMWAQMRRDGTLPK